MFFGQISRTTINLCEVFFECLYCDLGEAHGKRRPHDDRRRQMKGRQGPSSLRKSEACLSDTGSARLPKELRT